MDIKFNILTMDAEGIEHPTAWHLDDTSVSKFVDILISGENPNELTDIVIRPEIVR